VVNAKNIRLTGTNTRLKLSVFNFSSSLRLFLILGRLLISKEFKTPRIETFILVLLFTMFRPFLLSLWYLLRVQKIASYASIDWDLNAITLLISTLLKKGMKTTLPELYARPV
jgi:hypothetical protein